MNNVYSTNYNIKKVKRQHTECMKICANHISDTELVSRIYKLTINSKKTIHFKRGKGFEWTFLQRGYTSGQ